MAAGISRPVFMAVSLALGGWAPTAGGQTGVVTGAVFDQMTKRPLADVRVWLVPLPPAVRDATRPFAETRTSSDGRYVLRVAREGDYVVRAQRPGFAQIVTDTVQVADGRATVAHLVMRPVGLPAERVVASAAPSALEELPAPSMLSPLSSLAGRIAGARVLGGGVPGAREPSVLFRSPSSISRRSEPLIVIDGVLLPAGVPTSDLQPADIESIEVLKGPAAAAAFGSRGANGVILIRTARGRR
jgi:TonB-dependent SusC/RagA subfamily outer membrane receptor